MSNFVIFEHRGLYGIYPGHPQKLAEAMLRMLKDEDLRSRVIPAARQRVVRNFDNKRLIGDLTAVYQKEIEAFRDLP